MNSRSSSVAKSYENEFSEFLIKRIANAGGNLQLQHISGHLSQVRSQVRNEIGSSKSDLLNFLKRHNNLFIVNDNVVSLVNSSTTGTSGYDSDNSSIKSHSNLPSKIKNGKGVIVKITTGYGFIKSKEPIKTDVFFNSVCFGDRNIDLTSFLHVGAIVFFTAKLETSDLSCKYKAIKVWRVDGGDDESNVIIQKPRKSRETGLYDPMNLESEGVIQNIFPNLGFISVKDDNSNTVFFHKNRVVNYDNIVDLTKVFSKGDRVEFAAHRSSKPDAKARWEATKVWKISGKIEQNLSQSDNNQISLPKQPNLKNNSPEMIKNQSGKIYPRSHGAVIKFGTNEMADGDSADYYVCGTKVSEIGWEFTDGDDIYFDAVKIKSAPGWKAVLVWTDTRPNVVLRTCLGDFSEYTEEEEEDDNVETYSSIYTSKSSLCMSESSNSSLKSERMSSKASSMKEKSWKSPDSFLGKEIKHTNRLTKNRNTSSRDSLNSLPVSDKYCFVGEEIRDTNKKMSKNRNTSSKDSLNSLPVSEKHCFVGKEIRDTNKKLSKYNTANRDNLPSSDKYHSLKSSENVSRSSSNKSVDQLNKMVSCWGDTPYTYDEAYDSMEVPKSFKSETCLKYDNETKHFTEDEMENSSEYASAEEEKTAEIENEMNSSQNDNLKCAAAIKRYYDIKGEINKVFSRFAEVKSWTLQNAVSFSLNDFYINGKSIDEAGLEDLKDILKIGDTISFNCFVIIDDLGQTWQKVTSSWKGFKPKNIKEIDPEDFIKKNNLSVTVNNQISNDEMIEKVIKRKFLSSFTDEIPDDNIDNLSKTESCSEEESLTLSSKSQVGSKTELPIVPESLSDTVYKMLKRDLYSNNSVVDIKSVSEEIINIILHNYTKKTNTLTSNFLPEEHCTTKTLENICSKCEEKSLSHVKTKNTAVQTIVTGDIISQNILPDC